jgi:hypothetical protein
MSLRPPDRERGLAALNEARQTRRRAIVFGRVRVREVATGFWLMTFAGLLIFSFAYYRYTLVELDARRSEILAKQRALGVAVGTDGFALRERLEGWVIALAGGGLAPMVAPDAKLDELVNGPVIYARLRQKDALDAEHIRKAAGRSLRDGFTSCLFVGQAAPPAGVACSSTSQCGPGEVCSDWKTCAAPAHPYNLSLLYEGLRALDPAWTTNLEAAGDELQLRAIELDLDDVAKHEAVAAVELVKRARYFAAVLDAEPNAPEPVADPAAPADETPEERLQASDHRVKVGVWDIQRGAPLALLDVQAAGRFLRLGGSGAPLDPKTARAQQRQANNCTIGTEVREALAAGRIDPPSADPPDAPAPPGVASGQ